MKMKPLKYSRQRESIKEFLQGRTDHPTADTVYTNIREIYPNISLGTVYRNLALLASLGEIQKITCEDGADRFDPGSAAGAAAGKASAKSSEYLFLRYTDSVPPLEKFSEKAKSCINLFCFIFRRA